MSRRKKIKQTFQEEGQFLAFPYSLLDHPDYLSLSWAAQSLLTHMGRLFNGNNNGDISIPISIMLSRGWSRSTLNKAKKELIANDWIRVTRQGEKRKCSLYALSWKALDECKVKLDINLKLYKPRSLKA